jgi:nucleoside-diphosphate-sugar epimerase
MKHIIHTVLGASGATGRAVIQELKRRNYTVRAVQRTKKDCNTETFEADLLHLGQAIKAIEGSTYVYFCTGLPYNSKIWQADWPQLMENVITACERAKAKLIFLDNIYMYSQPLATPFTEGHAQNPITKKGTARKQSADILLSAMAKNRVKAVIGRSADFYGEYATNSTFYISFLENMLKNKPPQLLGKKQITHTFANVSDNAKALVALALDDATYGQVWHLPVGKPITFDEINDIINAELGTHFKVGYLPKPMRKVLSWFVPPIKEVEEVMYQFENNYEMNFDKFKKHFPDFAITPYPVGIKAMIQSFKSV